MAHLRPLDARGALVALLLAALWGGNPVAVKIGLAGAPPLRLAWMRFVLGGLCILAYARYTRRQGVLTVKRGEWSVLGSLGLLFTVQIGLMNIGINLTTAAHASVLLNSYAIHTVVLAHFFIPGDRMTPAKLGGVAMAYGGIVLLFTRDFSFQSGTLLGDLVVAASALLLGERTVYMARAVQRFDPVKLLLGQSAIGSACFFLASHWWEAAFPTHYTVSLAASLFYQGVIVAGFNFVVNTWQLEVYRPSALAACALTSPIWGVLLSAAIAGDPLTPTLLLSSLMVAAGIGLATRR
ncbi:MAG: DMT family transporter [Candidatus Rokubacteria bacterium]|nr:DMT family transporter [Candidatus Rokubacteria bacterium]